MLCLPDLFILEVDHLENFKHNNKNSKHKMQRETQKQENMQKK